MTRTQRYKNGYPDAVRYGYLSFWYVLAARDRFFYKIYSLSYVKNPKICASNTNSLEFDFCYRKHRKEPSHKLEFLADRITIH